MKWLKRWKEKRENKKEFKKMFAGILEAVKEMVLFEPNSPEKHREIEQIVTNMFSANGCCNVKVVMNAEGERLEITKMKINLDYHGCSYSIYIGFMPTKVKI